MRVKLYQCGAEPSGQLSEYPLGLGYLKASSPPGHDVQIVKTREELVDCDLIGLSSAAHGLREAVEILYSVGIVGTGKGPRAGIPVVLGGQGALWEPVAQLPFTYIVQGEGEIAWQDILSETCPKNRPLRYSPVSNIDALHFPDRGRCGPTVPILTARGCPWNCAFCTARAQWGGVRYHSVEYVMEEVDYILGRYPHATGLYIMDDLFAADTRRLYEMDHAWRRLGYHKRLGLHGFVRSNTFDLNIGEMMKRMGFTSIRFGGESGSNAVLKRLNKCATVEDHQRTIDLATELGLPVGASWMYDTPGETPEEAQETIDFIKRNEGRCGIMGFYRYASWPGTDLWDGTSPLEVDMRVR